MKQLEQARLFLKKASQDAEILDLMGEGRGSDEVYGFHAQQAVEKLLKAVLSCHSVRVRKTHDLDELFRLVSSEGLAVPVGPETFSALTDFGTLYRY